MKKTFIGQNEMCRDNCITVLEMVQRFGRLTRRQLEAELGMSWGGVTNVVNRLLSAGYLCERKEEKNGSTGRTPGVLEINGQDNFILGADVNDTGLSACMMNLKGEIISEHHAKADFTGKDALLNSLLHFIQGVLNQYDRQHILSVGISMQGEVDEEGGVSLRLTQCPGWEKQQLREYLHQHLGKEVLLAHDPDCMLLNYMESRDSENVILIRLDKSVGMAVALRGEILHGNGLWEIKQTQLAGDGRARCLDDYVSACGVSGKLSEQALHELAQPLAIAVGNACWLLRPDTLILCGDLMRHKNVFMDDFRAHLSKLWPNTDAMAILAETDAAAARKGAATLAMRHAVRQIEI
ncbi:MAG: ROK family transcriptional regulator [Clostridiaceae bacterium]|nr:ROK family transcriptional regulator [Clostridiaceae bacterium]